MIPLDSAFQFCVLKPQEPSPGRALSLIHTLPVATPDQFYDSFEKAATILPKHLGSRMALTVEKTSRCVTCQRETSRKVRRFSLPVTQNVLKMQGGGSTDTQTIVQNMLQGASGGVALGKSQTGARTFGDFTCKYCKSNSEPVSEYKITELGETLCLLFHASHVSVLISQNIKAGGNAYTLGGVVCMSGNGLALLIVTPLGCSVVQSDRGIVTESKVEFGEVSSFLQHGESSLEGLGKPIAAVYRYDFTLSKPNPDLKVKTPTPMSKNTNDLSDVNEDIFKDGKFLSNLRIGKQTDQLGQVSPKVTKKADKDKNDPYKSKRTGFDLEDSLNTPSYSITHQSPDNTIPYSGTNPNNRLSTTGPFDFGRSSGRYGQRPLSASITLPTSADSHSNNTGNDGEPILNDVMVLELSDSGSKPHSKSQSTSNIKTYKNDYSTSGTGRGRRRSTSTSRYSTTNSRSHHSKSRNSRYNTNNPNMASQSMTGSGTVYVDKSRYANTGTLNIKSRDYEYGTLNSTSGIVLYNQENNTVSTIPYVRSKLITSKIAFTVIIILIILLVFAVALFIALIVEYILYNRAFNENGLIARFDSLTVNTVNVLGMESSSQTSSASDEPKKLKTMETRGIKTLDESDYDLIVYGSIHIYNRTETTTVDSSYVNHLVTNSLYARHLDLTNVPTEMSESYDIFELLLDENNRLKSKYSSVYIETAKLSSGTLNINNLVVKGSSSSFSVIQTNARSGATVTSRLEMGVNNSNNNSIKSSTKISDTLTVSGETYVGGSINTTNAEIDISYVNYSTNQTIISGTFNAPIITSTMEVDYADTRLIQPMKSLDNGTIKEVYIYNDEITPYIVESSIRVSAIEIESDLTFNNNPSFIKITGGTTIYSPECQEKDLVIDSITNMLLGKINAQNINITNTKDKVAKCEFNMAVSKSSKLSLVKYDTDKICIGMSCNMQQGGNFVLNKNTSFSNQITVSGILNLLANNITLKQDTDDNTKVCEITYDSSLTCKNIKTNKLESELSVDAIDLSDKDSTTVKSITAMERCDFNFKTIDNVRGEILLKNQSSFSSGEITITGEKLTIGSGAVISIPGATLNPITEGKEDVVFEIHAINNFITTNLDISNFNVDITGASGTTIPTLTVKYIDFKGGSFTDSTGNIALSTDTLTTLTTSTLKLNNDIFVKLYKSPSTPAVQFCVPTVSIPADDDSTNLTIDSVSLRDSLVGNKLSGYTFNNLNVENFSTQNNLPNVVFGEDNNKSRIVINNTLVLTDGIAVQNILTLGSSSTTSFNIDATRITGVFVPKGNNNNFQSIYLYENAEPTSLSINAGTTKVTNVYTTKYNIKLN